MQLYNTIDREKRKLSEHQIQTSLLELLKVLKFYLVLNFPQHSSAHCRYYLGLVIKNIIYEQPRQLLG